MTLIILRDSNAVNFKGCIRPGCDENLWLEQSKDMELSICVAGVEEKGAADYLKLQSSEAEDNMENVLQLFKH